MSDSTPKSAQIYPGPGYRICKDIDRPPQELIDQFRQFETPDISDILNRMYAINTGIQNLANDKAICGPACTVKVFPGDNLMVHKVLDIAKPGDVVVVDAGGSSQNAIVGDLISSKAKFRGIQAFVIDGLIRDLPDIREVGLPVFARGITPLGPLHRGPGEINYPVSCGGIVVEPGDIICGDASGLVVIRKGFAGNVLERISRQQKSMEEYVELVKQGVFSNQWVDDYLEQTQCVITES